MPPRTRNDADRSTQINRLFANNQWSRARRILLPALRREPRSHWLLTRLASTYYEQYDYVRALTLEKRALKLAPWCPLVKWDYACSLRMVGQVRESLTVTRSLLRRAVRSVAFGRCGEGLGWARSLLNDCFYHMATCYADLGKPALARRYLTKYLLGRKQGIKSESRMSEVRRVLGHVWPAEDRGSHKKKGPG